MKRAAIAYLLVILAVGLLVTLVMPEHSEEEEQPESKPGAAQPREIAPAREIGERVSRITGGVFFERVPRVEMLPPAELAKKLAPAPPREPGRSRAGALLLSQAGAFPPEQAEKLLGRRYGSAVAAAWVPDEFAVLVDAELAESDPKVAEAAAAGGLSRALETPVSDAPAVPPLFHDEEAVRATLQGGVAGLVERQYAERHLGGAVDVDAARESRRDPETPPAAETQNTFPATVGTEFVRGLHRRGGWEAVGEVLVDPPTTTNALLHANPAEAVRTPDFDIEQELGDGWKRLGAGDVGELDSAVLLRGGAGEKLAFKAVAGWRAGRFEAWQKGNGRCPEPCRGNTVTIVVHRWG
ncbi:MAG TPA: hypothetical protein VGR12_00385, partial [Solirubrobacteraceae bacterium]|nr:hypothetical protein [Solirubrobacteraceae bacterium]